MFKNTDLGCNLKTILCSDRVMKAGKDYKGVMRRDVECDDFRFDEHYTFVETEPWSGKRNPRVYNGRYISITRRQDGSLKPNFKPVKIAGRQFSIDSYAIGVCNELREALEGLVER